MYVQLNYLQRNNFGQSEKPPVIFPTGSVPIKEGGARLMKQISGKMSGNSWGLLRAVKLRAEKS